jgi:hypothetical protein
MKSKVSPRASQLKQSPNAHANVTRRARFSASAAVAAALLCLSMLPFAGAASSAGVGPHQKKGKPAATPQASPSPAPTPTPAQTPAATPTPTPTPPTAGQQVKLHYLREGTKIAAALNKIALPTDSPLKGLSVDVINEDEIILIGTKERRRLAHRIIATLDLPRPGVQMEMWGVQMSSKRPECLAEVMRRARAEIDWTQQDVRGAYAALQEFARDIKENELNDDFKRILEERLYYESALDPNRPLSLADILLRMVAANDPVHQAEELSRKLSKWLDARRAKRSEAIAALGDSAAAGQCKRSPVTVPPTAEVVPFNHFFENRGLEYSKGSRTWARRRPNPERDDVAENARIGKAVLLDFALHYGRLVHDPDGFDPYYLQQSAGALNTRLQSAIDALNLDMQEVFVVPTLDRIRRIAAEFSDVEYAQVGRTTVASLSGAQSVVSAGSVNTFDFIRPLTLNDFVTRAKAITENTKDIIPGPATTNKLGTVPFAEVIGLIGALGEDRTVTRKTTTDVSVTITPNVLRNMNSAELELDLQTGDPLAGGTQQEGTPQFTRISNHDVKTKVYVNALDFFDLSSFGNQATMNGGRGYVPILGPLWRGLFGEAPVIGQFLSWKKKPQTVYSQSLVLTTSFITPTAMGVALLVPTDIPDREEASFPDTPEGRKQRFVAQWTLVEDYEDCLFVRSRAGRPDPCGRVRAALPTR